MTSMNHFMGHPQALHHMWLHLIRAVRKPHVLSVKSKFQTYVCMLITRRLISRLFIFSLCDLQMLLRDCTTPQTHLSLCWLFMPRHCSAIIGQDEHHFRESIIVIFSYPSISTCTLGSHRDGSFECLQYMFWLRNKKNKMFNYALLSRGLTVHICNGS